MVTKTIQWHFHLPQWLTTSATNETGGKLPLFQTLAITSAKSIQIRHNICQQRIQYVTQHLSQYKTVTSVLQTKMKN